MNQTPTCDAAAAAPACGADSEEHFVRLYGELRRAARRELRRHPGELTLGTTGLLHETYLRLAGSESTATFASDGRFLSYVVRTMRSLIVDRARRRSRLKRGGDWEAVTWDTGLVAGLVSDHDVIRIDEYLEELSRLEPGLARVVELRFFGGLTFDEVAVALQRSRRSVQRDWEKARCLLVAMMADQVRTAA